MLFEIIVAFVGCVTIFTLGLMVHNCVMCQLAYWSFKKKSNNLPILGHRRLLGNHSYWLTKDNICNEVVKEHSTLGKTVGFLLNQKFSVSTIDLDLIKLVIDEEPDHHMNRIKLHLPIREIENSILMAEDDKWRKLRRHFAPAFK